MAESRDDVLRTFSARASSYEQESSWVTAEPLVAPLIPATRADQDCTRFLDLCAGTGSVARRAAAQGWTVLALDRSVEMLAGLDDASIWRVLGDAEEVPFADDSVEVAAIRQALHYTDCDRVIREMCRVTRHEVRVGHITLYDADDAEWWMKYFSIASPGRRRVFEPGAQARMLRDAGVAISDVTVLDSVESFMGPIDHLPPDKSREALELWKTAPLPLRQRHAVDGELSESLISVRWEFVRGTV